LVTVNIALEVRGSTKGYDRKKLVEGKNYEIPLRLPEPAAADAAAGTTRCGDCVGGCGVGDAVSSPFKDPSSAVASVPPEAAVGTAA
jgi:hypothetical protein